MDRRVKERLVGATILLVLVILVVPELLSGPKETVAPPQPTLPGASDPVRSITVDLATNKATSGTLDLSESAAGSAADSTGSGVAVGSGVDASGVATPGAATPGAVAPPGVANREEATHEEATPDELPLHDGSREMSSQGGGGASRLAPMVTTPAAKPPRAAIRSTRPAAAARAVDEVRHGWTAQLGSFATRANAEKLERQLKAQGFAPFVTSTGSGKTLRYRVRVGPVGDRGAAEKLKTRLRKSGHVARLVGP